MLELEAIEVYYADLQALFGVSLEVKQGEIVALIGPNGAGKTTTFRTIMGLSRPRTGSILFQGQRIDRLPPHQIVRRGITLVPEGRRIFPQLTVAENLRIGAYTRPDGGERRESLEEVFTLFPLLRERQEQVAGTMSGGERQMLAIGRALMARPKLLLLDEPSLGLAPRLVVEIFSALAAIRERGITILISEQHVGQVLELADRAYVIENGRIVLSGPAGDVLRNPHVREAYLGM
jgi:branched-chain amino acid transport system ATP-binding protein